MPVSRADSWAPVRSVCRQRGPPSRHPGTLQRPGHLFLYMGCSNAIARGLSKSPASYEKPQYLLMHVMNLFTDICQGIRACRGSLI